MLCTERTEIKKRLHYSLAGHRSIAIDPPPPPMKSRWGPSTLAAPHREWNETFRPTESGSVRRTYIRRNQQWDPITHRPTPPSTPSSTAPKVQPISAKTHRRRRRRPPGRQGWRGRAWSLSDSDVFDAPLRNGESRESGASGTIRQNSKCVIISVSRVHFDWY